MTGSKPKIEGSELARALAQDQREQRQEDQAALRRDEQIVDRLATELARRSDSPPGI